MLARALLSLLIMTALPSCSSHQHAGVEFLNPGRALPSGLPFSEAVRVDRTLYLSGMVGILPGTMELVPGGFEAESEQTMENIRLALEAPGRRWRTW